MEELVKRLRDIASWDWNGMDGEYVERAVKEAADAIEQLTADLERSKDFEAFWQHEAEEALKKYQVAISNKPRWIPVEERLPEKTNHYLVHVKCGCDGKLVSAWEQVAWFCEKFYWEHLHGDDVFEETITHWMPLPEPPKEE